MAISNSSEEYLDSVAIIGIAVRMPKALTVPQFWENLINGKESISVFNQEELIKSGISPEAIAHPNFIAAKGVMEEAEMFDAAFFGISPREAELMDPQHRVLMECAWDAMENAGYVSDEYSGRVSIFTSAGMNTYLPFNLMSNPDLLEQVGGVQLSIYCDKDFLPTRIAYSMNIRGPAIDIGTACSSSLVSTHLACQHLTTYQSDMALVGGITIHLPQISGHVHEPGAAYSPDEHCRPFDATPSGLIDGNGAAVIILKRVQDAIADGDQIYGVIKGSAINNDGSNKVGYSAPSIQGQAEVIIEAQANADVHPETISYVEAHGTATPLGDPIEVAGLTQAFRHGTQKNNFCGLGSVKSNIGHVDKAAGLAGLIKTTLALHHEMIPPSLHWKEPNPKLQLQDSPFYVVQTAQPWDRIPQQPRRAGISSFGVGGTNAHVILEEAPIREPGSIGRPNHIITGSAKSKAALDRKLQQLIQVFSKDTHLDIANIAYTLNTGRKSFNHRFSFRCSSHQEALQIIKSKSFTETVSTGSSQVIFMFTGQGSQYVDMAKDLYEQEQQFKEYFDQCAIILHPLIGLDIRKITFSNPHEKESNQNRLQETSITQPVLFALEYALAKLWMGWGVQPKAMIGHSVGEIVAACIADVLSLEDALDLIVMRSKLMQSLPRGSMLSVALSAEKTNHYILNHELLLDIAAVNAPELCVVSGESEVIDTLQKLIEKDGHTTQLLKTSHAYHSKMMDPILASFERAIQSKIFNPPKIPFISNITGNWVSTAEVTNPSYWGRHIRQSVQFNLGIKTILKDITDPIFLEIGPGKTLNQLVKLELSQASNKALALSSIPQYYDKTSAQKIILESFSTLWANQAPICWKGFYKEEKRLKVPLPSYPFERTPYWVEPIIKSKNSTHTFSDLNQSNPVDWFYEPSFKSTKIQQYENVKKVILIFGSLNLLHERAAKDLALQGHTVINAIRSDIFQEVDKLNIKVSLSNKTELEKLFILLSKESMKIDNVVYIGRSISSGMVGMKVSEKMQSSTYQGANCCEIITILQAIDGYKKYYSDEIVLNLIETEVIRIGNELIDFTSDSGVLGLIPTIHYEYPNIRARYIDVSSQIIDSDTEINHLIHFLNSPEKMLSVAIRKQLVWTEHLEKIQLSDNLIPHKQLHSQGNYLITGGLEGVGLEFTKFLAKRFENSNLIITTAIADFVNNPKIQQEIKSIEASYPCKLHVYYIDYQHTNPLADIVQKFQNSFQLNGIIHATDMSNPRPLDLINDFSLEKTLEYWQLESKMIEGIIKIAKNTTLDFCYFMSSLSAKIGAMSQVSHAIFSSQLSHMISKESVELKNKVSIIYWDRWIQDAESAFINTKTQGIRPLDGEQVLDYLFSFTVPQILIATNHPFSRLRTFSNEQLLPIKNLQTPTIYDRPELEIHYSAPENDLEKELTDIWQDFLKITPIGIHDNFFDLGGQSLLAAQLIRHIKDHLSVNLDLGIFFSAPTIAELSSILEKQLQESSDARMEKYLAEIENMTEEEVKNYLEKL